MKPQSFVKIVRFLILLIILIALYFLITETEIPGLTSQPSTQPTPTPQPEPKPPTCKGTARCLVSRINRIIDGDTLVVYNITIRLALTDTAEDDQEAKQFTTNTCPAGSTALVDVDDGQPFDKFNRTIAVVYCNNTNLNEALLINGHAFIDQRYCNISEFKNESWAKNHGCMEETLL